MISVLHVIPSLRVGGIETMMTRFLKACPSEIEYQLLVLSRQGKADIPLSDEIKSRVLYIGPTNSPLTYLRAAYKILKSPNALVVSSTWRAAIVIWLANKVLALRGRHIAFTHRSSAAHRVDHLLRTWQVKNCILNLADSNSSADWVKFNNGEGRVVVLPPIFSPPENMFPREGRLRICFIGRLAPVKNLETVVRLIETIARQGVSLTFHVYGPDAGSKAEVDSWMDRCVSGDIDSKLDLEYRGPLPPEAVQSVAATYHFIVSCSHTEGFAMSIAEAMQVGTVPVVGNIGGPSTYCCENNAIVLVDYSNESLEGAAQKLVQIWLDQVRYLSMSDAASRTFKKSMYFPNGLVRILKEVHKDDFARR